MNARRRRRFGALIFVVLLCAVLAPSAGAVVPADRAFALSNGALLSFDPAAPGNATKTAIVGISGGETLVGIDVRPQNGMLYGLGVNATSDTATLYAISPETGVAGVVGAASGTIKFTTNGVTVVDFPDAGYGFDFNPATDRVRVTASNGLNFRVNPNNGAPVDGDNGGGVTSGTNPDGKIVNAGNTVDGTAYTNNRANNGNVTTLYTLSATSDQLAIQSPANVGTQTGGKDVVLNGAPVNVAAVGGFDIDASVDAPASNGAVTAGVGYAALTIGATNHLYKIDLVSGTATDAGAIGDGTAAIQGLALQRDLADAGYPLVALTADHLSLARLQTATPGSVTTAALTGVTAGETVIGITWRPQTGQLYGLGVNATANTATLYVMDPQLGTATVVGVAGQIAFTTDGVTAVDFPDPAVVGWGIDVNPTVDRIRVVTGSGLNFRVNAITGAPVDSSTPPAGTNPDGAINGLDPGSFGVTAVAYTNAFGQSLTGGTTTQYVLEPVANKLYIQNPPNTGTVTLGKTVTLGGSPVDFTSVGGLDLPAQVRVDTSNTPATGTGLAAFTVAGVSGLYSLDLSTAVATFHGAVSGGIASLAVGRAQPASPVVPPPPPPGPGAAPGPDILPVQDLVKPLVSKLALASAKKKKVTVTFTSSEAGRATIKLIREVKGRRAGKACKPKATKGRRCTKRTTYGSIAKAIPAAGKVTVKVAGKVGRKALKAGGLRVEVSIRDAAGNVSAKAVKSGKVKK